jgi:hypothetical protein
MTTLEATQVWRNVAAETFREEIRPRYRPALLKALVADWPSVRAAAHAPQAILSYVGRFDLGRPVETFVGDPAIQGRFWYQKDMRGFNFERRRESFADFASRLTQHLEDERPPAIYMGAASIADGFPEFAAHNPAPLVDHRIVPRLWMGNAVEVATHYDIDENLACVVAGRRRFTLFPPDQLPNLYVGLSISRWRDNPQVSFRSTIRIRIDFRVSPRRLQQRKSQSLKPATRSIFRRSGGTMSNPSIASTRSAITGGRTQSPDRVLRSNAWSTRS